VNGMHILKEESRFFDWYIPLCSQVTVKY